jgi:hypothetical protein
MLLKLCGGVDVADSVKTWRVLNLSALPKLLVLDAATLV